MCPRTQLHVRRTKDIWCIRPHNEAGHIPWVISFLATCSPLISGKHLPGITNDACSGPGPLHRYVASGPRLRSMWAAVTVLLGHRSIRCGPRLRHVGHDYGENRKCGPHQNGIPARIAPFSRPTSNGITGPHRPEYAHYFLINGIILPLVG